MKQLLEDLNNILHSAEKTTATPSRQALGLTSGAGKMIMETIKQCKPCNHEEVLASLVQCGIFSQTTRFNEKAIYTEYGVDNVPLGIEGEVMDKQALSLAINELGKPIDKQTFVQLYTKLKYSVIKRPEDYEDEKMRAVVYFDEMRKYPAYIAEYALSKPYKYFPSLYELREEIDFAMKYWDFIKEKMNETPRG